MVPLGITRANVPDYMVRGGTAYRIIPDHLGSPRFVVDVATGVVAQEMRYDEFGRITLDTSPGFQPFGFAGGLYDHQAGLVRFGARDYDPEIGRWTTPDPSGFAGGLNLYGYADQNPQSFVDRTGEVPVAAGIAIALGLIEAGMAIWDTYDTGTTLIDPCASPGDKLLSGAGYVGGALGPGPGGLYKGLGKKALELKQKLPRFNGPKPTYHVNQAHVPGMPGFNPKKTPLPPDAEDVYQTAVPNSPDAPRAWFGRNADGQIYRYSPANDGTAHFSGIDGVGDGVRNLTPYAVDRLNGG